MGVRKATEIQITAVVSRKAREAGVRWLRRAKQICILDDKQTNKRGNKFTNLQTNQKGLVQEEQEVLVADFLCQANCFPAVE